jgi:ABC-type nitrate/sulfonate/bicarbonate transport system permease component
MTCPSLLLFICFGAVLIGSSPAQTDPPPIPPGPLGDMNTQFIGGNHGFGYIVVSSGSTFRTDRIFAALVYPAFIGLLLLVSIQLIERLFLKRFYRQ